ncbi:hypothetical protein [Nocardiopsis deserti]|uniref:hypothetical protein n=1 Tax=Nocardiopsis deserti TaxID=2605988 RepID=UPI00123B160F|nr:hypothetical protein [Nocardiopsis deserti]
MHTLPTPAPITTVLNLPAAHIHIIAADRTDTTVQIQPANPSKNRDVQAAEQTTITHDDGVLHIQAPTPKHQAFGPSGRVHNALKDDGATALDIHATTSHGDITARSL